jgi:hypothetical protein
MPLHIFQRGPDKPFRTTQQLQALRRINDLTRIYRDQYPAGLPHNGLGFKYAKYMIRTKAFVDSLAKREKWLDRYAPFLSADERTKILGYSPHWYSDKSLGDHLELYDEDRERLQAWTIAACDVTREERDAINVEKNRRRQEQHRRKNQSKPRAEYLAEVKGTEPWKDEGVSRATWYRRRKDCETGSVTAPSSIHPFTTAEARKSLKDHDRADEINRVLNPSPQTQREIQDRNRRYSAMIGPRLWWAKSDLMPEAEKAERRARAQEARAEEDRIQAAKLPKSIDITSTPTYREEIRRRNAFQQADRKLSTAPISAAWQMEQTAPPNKYEQQSGSTWRTRCRPSLARLIIISPQRQRGRSRRKPSGVVCRRRNARTA